MNNLSHAMRKFNRFELKYLLSLEQAQEFRSALLPYLAPDEHGNGNGRYALESLYYDAPDLRCYREKVDGVKFRRKLRIRRYVSSQALNGETLVFVEIKQRVDRVTQKRRVVLPYAAAARFCDERQRPTCTSGDESVVNEIEAFLWQYNLRASAIVRYDRQAMVGTDNEIGLRVTFDTHLTCQAYPLRLDDIDAPIQVLPPDLVVMEIKVNERIPYWLTELVSIHNLKLTRISKYCLSVETAQLVAYPHSLFRLPGLRV
jgi:SPX domain protein involved in polyphosphate accumulation